MDSLLVNYASSDDDENAEDSRPILPLKASFSTNSVTPQPPSRPSAASSSSPSSSLFSSLAPLKSRFPNHLLNEDKRDAEKPSGSPMSSSMFSFLPPPKIRPSSTFSSIPVPKLQSGKSSNNLSFDQHPNKRVVHVTVPLIPSMLSSHDSDNDEDEEEMRRNARKDASSLSTPNTLTSLLPAPKNSLCMASAQSASASRRSSLQAAFSSQNSTLELKAEEEGVCTSKNTNYCAGKGPAAGYCDASGYNAEQGLIDYEDCTNDAGNWPGNAVDPGAFGSSDPTYVSAPAITSWEQVNGNVVDYESYTNNCFIVSRGAQQPDIPDFRRITGKRGRTDIPTEIVEVKQDELMKNRPREDQVKLTGIAFGPAYQPAPSTKAKPSKLHKRKHQIGSLYYDLKQKEMELAERRSRGLLTKAETQAKYGW